MIAAALLTIVVIAYRIVLGIMGAAHLDWLHNFSPMASVVLCGAIFFPRQVAIAFPLLALFLSDLALNAGYILIPNLAPHLTNGVSLVGAYMIPKYVALGLVGLGGWLLREHARTWNVLLASVGGSILFYVITNTGAWFADPAYARTFAGWLQALTSGLPGLPPTVTFLKHSVASDVVFTGLFLACLAWGDRRHVPASASDSSVAPRAALARRLR